MRMVLPPGVLTSTQAWPYQVIVVASSPIRGRTSGAHRTAWVHAPCRVASSAMAVASCHRRRARRAVPAARHGPTPPTVRRPRPPPPARAASTLGPCPPSRSPATSPSSTGPCWPSLAVGSFGVVALLRLRTDATKGYLGFTALCAAGFGALAWLSDGALPAAAAAGSPVTVDPTWDVRAAPRSASLAAGALVYAALLFRGRRAARSRSRWRARERARWCSAR